MSAKIRFENHIKYDVGVSRARHDPEIMETDGAGNLRKRALYYLRKRSAVGIIHVYRIHVGCHNNVKVAAYLFFYVVHQIMAYHHVDFRIHFDMYGGENLAGTIVMHHKVMDAENPFKTQSRLFNLMNKLRIRSLPQKRADSLSYQTYA